MRSWLIQVSLSSLPYLQRTLIQKLVHRTTPPKFPDQKLWWSKDLRMRRPSRKIFAGVCYFAGQSSPKPFKKTLVCTLFEYESCSSFHALFCERFMPACGFFQKQNVAGCLRTQHENSAIRTEDRKELSTNGVAMTTISVGQTRLFLFFLKICKMKRNINLRTGLPLNFS